MTNELGTTLQDIKAKARRKREALECAYILYTMAMPMYLYIKHDITSRKAEETIRKYIEEN